MKITPLELFKILLFAALLSAISLLVLWPGLHGSFYLDDYPNLAGLPRSGDVSLSWLNYLLNPPVGGSGRPIAYISFMLQSDSWPTQPYPFKLVNLYIHLVNGALVSVLAYLIGRVTFFGEAKSTKLVIISLLAGFIWLILPMSLSTVFYVVQRMTLLSTSMILIALIGFCYLRGRYDKWARREYLIATFILGVGYLGVFAKETAVLTGLLVLAIDYAVFSKVRAQLSKTWKLIFLVLPLGIVFGYLLLAGRIFGEYSYRPFTFSQRILSESVIVLDYLGKILFPTNARINLYNDGYPFESVSGNHLLVFFTILVWIVLFIIAMTRKKRMLSFGVLFFLTAHLLESTVIPLELYFEHRNYLPAVGLIIALTIGLGEWLLRLRQSSRLKGTFALLLVILWIGWIAVVSAIEARVWGDPRAFAVAALTERPNSLRARQEFGTFLMGVGDYMGAANVLYSIDSRFGIFAGTYAQLLMLKCYEADVPVPSQSRLRSILEGAAFDRGTEPALQDIWRMKRFKRDACQNVSVATLLSVIEALLSNPAYRNRNDLHVLKSLVLADQGEWIKAAEAVDQISRDRLTVEELVLGARFYSQAGEHQKAMALLSEAESLSSGPLSKVVHAAQIEKVRATITGKEGKVYPGVSTQ